MPGGVPIRTLTGPVASWRTQARSTWSNLVSEEFERLMEQEGPAVARRVFDLRRRKMPGGWRRRPAMAPDLDLDGSHPFSDM
jgi:hypothetical protein